MNNNKVEMLENYIKAGVGPILLEDFSTENLKNGVILEADCDVTELNGHYENIDFLPPQWYEKILQKSKNTYSLLIINELNKIPKEEQLKFLELFKYRKISTFDLPQNCVIVATCSNLKDSPIAEELYSLLVHI